MLCSLIMKKVQFIKPAPPMHWVGDGFPVRSIFSHDSLGRELDPFLLMDYAAPHHFEPSSSKRGVGAHPHRGFETVTLALQGEVTHRDSHGGGGSIGPGDVQWMTAASGLLHEEFHSEDFTQKGGLFQMVQLWVNLPAKDKNAAPRYQNLTNDSIPVIDLPKGGSLRVVAGDHSGTHGPAQTFTPVDLWEIKTSDAGTLTLPAKEGHTTALLVMDGGLNLGEEKASPGTLVVFQRDGEGLEVIADSGSHLLFLGGEPIGEPIAGYGPFVMNHREEILQAIEDFQAGKMGRLES